jgi:hypothetical protein
MAYDEVNPSATAIGICWPKCASYSCEGDCDGDGDCAPGAGDDCDHSFCFAATGTICTPVCAGSNCGSDGCGGECSPGCTASEACSSTGVCVPVDSCTSANDACLIDGVCYEKHTRRPIETFEAVSFREFCDWACVPSESAGWWTYDLDGYYTGYHAKSCVTGTDCAPNGVCDGGHCVCPCFPDDVGTPMVVEDTCPDLQVNHCVLSTDDDGRVQWLCRPR